MTIWRDVPPGGEGYWFGKRYRRTSDAIVESMDRDTVEVEYLERCGPDDSPIEPGTHGLIDANDSAEEEIPF